jgi:hypothetical protein
MENLIYGIGSRVKHEKFGAGVVTQVWPDHYEIVFMDYGMKQVIHGAEQLDVIEFRSQDPDELSFDKVEKLLVKILRKFSDVQETVPMGERWIGGKMILQPGSIGLQSKEVPIETFFHKIVMVRDRLRVLEQRVNASKLSDEEKVDIQQYITRIYGSLTTFNVLFADKEDYFTGDKSSS